MSTLILEHNPYFPAHPLESHTPPDGRSGAAVRDEKRAAHRAMHNLADHFRDHGRGLVRRAADLALLYHHNHYRHGRGQEHYTSHLLAVARLVHADFGGLGLHYELLKDGDGHPLDPRAVAVTVALLHDALEDFHKNFHTDDRHLRSAGHLTAAAGAALCAAHAHHHLAAVAGPQAADRLVGIIRTLSIDNADDFPTGKYLAAIQADPYAYTVKLADVEHNLSTFVHFSPVYACLVAAAQYAPLAAGTFYEARYRKHVLTNLAAFDPHEHGRLPTANGRPTVEVVLGDLARLEGLAAFERIRAYYRALAAAGPDVAAHVARVLAVLPVIEERRMKHGHRSTRILAAAPG